MRARWNPRRFPVPRSVLVLAAGASAPSTAGRVMGGFTLPVAASWGGRRLAAGDYTFVVAPATSPGWVYVRGGDEATVFFATSVQGTFRPHRDKICLAYDGSGYRVSSLKLRDAGKILRFDAGRPGPVPLALPAWAGVLSALPRRSAGRREPVLKPSP